MFLLLMISLVLEAPGSRPSARIRSRYLRARLP